LACDWRDMCATRALFRHSQAFVLCHPRHPRHTRYSSVVTIVVNRSLLTIGIGSIAGGTDETYHEVMRAKTSATELARELAADLHWVHRQGQSFLIEQDGEAVATLEPLGVSPGSTWRTLTNALRGLPNGDRDFASDLEEVQRNQPDIPTDVWPN